MRWEPINHLPPFLCKMCDCLSYFGFRYYHIGRVYDRIRGVTHFVFQSYHIVRVYHDGGIMLYWS